MSDPTGPERVPAMPAGIATAAILVSAGFLASRLLGVVRTTAIANAFGTDSDLAAYWVAFRLPDLIFQLVAGATLASAFIPVFARTMVREGSDAAWRLASSVVNFVLLGTLAFAIIAFILAPWLVPLLAPGLGEGTGRQREIQDSAVELTRWMLVSPVFFSLGGMAMGILNARRHFLTPAFAPVTYNLAIIFGALVLAKPWGVHGLVAGVVAGSALHFLVQVPALRFAGMRYAPHINWRTPEVREVFRLMAPRTIGLAAAQLNFFVTTIFFASLVGDDAISAITYAWLLATLPLALFGMAISTAAFPEMAEQAALDQPAVLGNMIGRNLQLILFFTLPASVGLMLLSRPITVLLLQHGAFSASASHLTAGALFFLAIGLCAHASIEILARGFYALSNTLTPMLIAVVAAALNFIFALLLIGPLDERGVALALSLATAVEAALLWLMLQRRLSDVDWSGALRSIAHSAVATAVMAVVVGCFVFGFDLTQRTLETLVLTGAAIILGAAAYFATAIALRMPETGLVLRQVGRLRGRLP